MVGLDDLLALRNIDRVKVKQLLNPNFKYFKSLKTISQYKRQVSWILVTAATNSAKPISPSPLISKSLKISSNHSSVRSNPLFVHSSLVTWPNRRKVSVKLCHQNISDPSLISYEPHLFHFLKTDFPILVGVHACKGCSQGLLTMCHLSRPGNFTMKKKYQRTLCVCYARCMSTPWYNARTGLACWRNFRCQPFGAECENMKILNILQPKYVHWQLPLWWFRYYFTIFAFEFYACRHFCIYFPDGTFNVDLPISWSKEMKN